MKFWQSCVAVALVVMAAIPLAVRAQGVGGGYIKVSKHFCDSAGEDIHLGPDIIGEYRSLPLARKACDADEHCLAISDGACDGRGMIYTCKSATGKTSRSSCMYAKQTNGPAACDAHASAVSTLFEKTNLVEDACCPGEHRRLQGGRCTGLPSKCTKHCASVFIGFYKTCTKVFPKLKNAMVSLYNKCMTTNTGGKIIRDGKEMVCEKCPYRPPGSDGCDRLDSKGTTCIPLAGQIHCYLGKGPNACPSAGVLPKSAIAWGGSTGIGPEKKCWKYGDSYLYNIHDRDAKCVTGNTYDNHKPEKPLCASLSKCRGCCCGGWHDSSKRDRPGCAYCTRKAYASCGCGADVCID